MAAETVYTILFTAAILIVLALAFIGDDHWFD